jgi:uncharacterized protein (TIGR03032 family)
MFALAEPTELKPRPADAPPSPAALPVEFHYKQTDGFDSAYSFVPRWRPPFVTAFTALDQCHLNGLALLHGQPKYVTALGETDTAGGWRANKPQGGCLMEVSSGEIICRGLSMPHSPRSHDGRLWLLESGVGRLVLVDPATGRPERVAELPGFARGLAFSGPYAFVGLSKIRKTSAMDGVPLAQRPEQLKCGVAAVDLRSGQVIALLEFLTAVEEIFDVQIAPGLRFPEVIGFQQETIQHTFVVPPLPPGASSGMATGRHLRNNTGRSPSRGFTQNQPPIPDRRQENAAP